MKPLIIKIKRRRETPAKDKKREMIKVEIVDQKRKIKIQAIKIKKNKK